MKFLTVSLLAGYLLAAAGQIQAQVVDGIAAIVNEAIITHDDVLNDVARVWDLLERTYSRQPEILNQKKAETYKQSLEELVQRKLILHEFKTAGYILPESVIEDNINDRIREQFGAGVPAVEERWEGDRLNFSARSLGQRVSGRVDVMETSVRIELDLPWGLALLAEKLQGRVKRAATAKTGVHSNPFLCRDSLLSLLCIFCG